MVKKWILMSLMVPALILAACSEQATTAPSLPTTLALPSQTPLVKAADTATPEATQTPTQAASPSAAPTLPPALTATEVVLVPPFKHIVIMVFENKEYETVIGNSQMPNYNKLASQYTLLNQYFAIMHPSLPNYLTLIGGDTFKFTSDYLERVIDAPSLPDYIEASGRTWKTYQESMPQACGLEDTLRYVQKHNPFVFFKSVRENPERCQKHVVPLTELSADLKQGTLPNYAFIMPNLCNSAHDSYSDPEKCSLKVADAWLQKQVDQLLTYQPLVDDGVIVVTWDEGQGDHSCCGLRAGGGRVPTLLISSKVKKGFQDETPYTHYSLLKTISQAWVLPALGHAADPENVLITAPWQN